MPLWPVKPTPPTTDRLFATVEAWQGARPWGRVLDAGAGRHSLDWIQGLPTLAWTGITAGAPTLDELRQHLAPRMRTQDRLLAGNWTDAGLLAGERFETVLADYLLGAIDGFAPYFQDRLFARLRPHVEGTLYVIGLEPITGRPDGEAARVIDEIHRLRDACILLAGHRCYREYPLDWVLRSLGGSGFRVEQSQYLPIVYGPRHINGQLDVCLRKLPLFADPALAAAMRETIEATRARALRVHDRLGGLATGADWVVQARPV